MPAPLIHTYSWAQLTLAALEDGTTETLYLTSQSGDFATNSLHYPIVKSMNGLEFRMDDTIPARRAGSITLDNSPHSFGFERRFSDLFQRKTPVGQYIYIKAAQVANVSDVNFSGGWTILKTICTDWTIDIKANTLTLRVESDPFERRIITKAIDNVSFTDPPTKSLGKHLPIVFGEDVQVKPHLMLDTEDNPYYAYATTLAGEHVVEGVQKYYAKNHESDYIEVSSLADTSSYAYARTSGAVKQRTYDPEYAEYCYPIITEGANYIITGVEIKFDGSGAGGSAHTDGLWQVRVYTLDPSTGIPITTLATATVEKTDYTSDIQGSSDFWVSFGFNKPVVIDSSVEFSYGFGLTNTEPSNNSSNEAQAYDSTAESYAGVSAIRYADGAANGKQGWYSTIETYALSFVSRFHGCVMTDDPHTGEDDNGLGYARFDVTRNSQSGAAPNINKLDYIVEINGLEDDGSGSITGSANSLITRPDHAVQCLSQAYDGSNWVNPRIDTSDYSTELDNLYTSDIKIAGKTTGRAVLKNVLSAICRDTGMRLMLRSSTIPAVMQAYARGTEQASIMRVTDEHCKIINVYSLGANEHIFNRVEAHYKKILVTTDLITGTSEGRFKDYAKTIIRNRSTNSDYARWIGESETLYGQRYAKQNTYDWFSDDDSAEKQAELELREFSQERWFADIEMPFFTNGALPTEPVALQLGDVFELAHPDLPSFLGTSSNARPPVHNGEQVKIGGMRSKRASVYKVQAEGQRLEWTDKAPTAKRLTVRLLINDQEVI